MKRLVACLLLLSRFATANLPAQESATRPRASSPVPATATAKTEKGPAPAASKPAAKDPLKTTFGGNLLGTPSDQPVTTEIYADQAFFDSQNYMGTFSGRVVVKDPRFNLQADKLTVYLAKGEKPGLEKAIAEGSVGVMQERPGENGGPPVRSIGRAERVVYTASDGNVELTGMPRVQNGLNSHMATSPETVMLINQSGQLTTKGPSRTELRQEPKPEVVPKP